MAISEKLLRMPSLMSLCVDESKDGHFQGRAYGIQLEDTIEFRDINEFIINVETYLNAINGPESTVKYRAFKSIDEIAPFELTICEPKEKQKLLEQKGRRSTFIFSINHRDNATWQGEIYSVDKDINYIFISEIEFIDFINKMGGSQ